MDFARKQLEKYGWKEGEGLGKAGNQGIKTAIKPHYKKGKEGMGFDLAKELTDTWWTRSLDASLKNVNVEVDTESGRAVVKAIDGAQNEDAPTTRIHKRMMQANFTQFSKGGTLTQGKLLKRNAAESDSSSDSEDDGPTASKISQLTDEQLLLACGGRTAHKGARHGFKCTGKLARLEAQDEYLMANPDKLLPKEKRNKKKKSKEDTQKSKEDTKKSKEVKKKSKKSKKDKERLDESTD